MTSPTLASLVTPAMQASALSQELEIAQSLGLPTSSWFPLDPSRTILQVQAGVISSYSQTVALIAQGGYLSYAALMIDVNGAPITSWMDLVSINNYNVTRIPAALAAGSVLVGNASGTTYTYSPNQPLHFQHPVSGATYTTTGSGTIAGGGSNVPVLIQADAAFAGHVGTAAAGVTLILLTPLTGVTVVPLTASLIGSDAETNAALLLRCQNKLGSLSPNGAPQAYQYVATSLPVFGSILPDGTQFNAPTSSNPYGVKAAVTRSETVLNFATGIVDLYVANAAGGLLGCVANPVTNVTWSAGTATVTTASSHNLVAGDWVIISGVLGATGVNNSIADTPAWQLTSASTNTMQFALAANPGTYASGGSVEGGDLGMVDAAIQAQVVPGGCQATTLHATTTLVNVTGTIYLRASSGISASAAQTNVSNALVAYFAALPIGGITAEAPNIAPYSEILATVQGANTGTVSCVLTAPTADITLGVGVVAALGTATIAVVFV